MDDMRFSTRFGMGPDATWDQANARARELADEFFDGQPYDIDIDVELVTSVSGKGLHKMVDVTARPNFEVPTVWTCTCGNVWPEHLAPVQA